MPRHRAAALVQRASSGGGGLLVCYEHDGAIRFREHTDDARPHAYATLPSMTLVSPVRVRRVNEDVDLRVTIAPAGLRIDVTAAAIDRATGTVLASARRSASEADVRGAVSLVSHAGTQTIALVVPDPAGGRIAGGHAPGEEPSGRSPACT